MIPYKYKKRHCCLFFVFWEVSLLLVSQGKQFLNLLVMIGNDAGVGFDKNNSFFNGNSSGEMLKPLAIQMGSYSKARHLSSGVCEITPTTSLWYLTVSLSIFLIFLVLCGLCSSLCSFVFV